jgi:hypothetical protein
MPFKRASFQNCNVSFLRLDEIAFPFVQIPHTENKLSRHNFISKRFSGLCYPKGTFIRPDFLQHSRNLQNTLSRFWTQI